jgi:hypothetical protein
VKIHKFSLIPPEHNNIKSVPARIFAPWYAHTTSHHIYSYSYGKTRDLQSYFLSAPEWGISLAPEGRIVNIITRRRGSRGNLKVYAM